ncbi:MAG: hypothetical protein ACRDSE_21750 [Pseudonocardiaceae bacterium]
MRTSLVGIDAGGGGFGDPVTRDPVAVLDDVLEGWVSREQAELVYKVVLRTNSSDGTLVVDDEETARRRSHPDSSSDTTES